MPRKVAKYKIEYWGKNPVIQTGRKKTRYAHSHNLHRNAEKLPRNNVNSVTQRNSGVCAAFRQIKSDLCAGIAHSDHQDGLAEKRFGVDVSRLYG